MRVSDVGLSSKMKATQVLVEAGGVGTGRYALRGRATGTRDYGGDMTLKVRF